MIPANLSTFKMPLFQTPNKKLLMTLEPLTEIISMLLTFKINKLVGLLRKLVSGNGQQVHFMFCLLYLNLAVLITKYM